MHHLTRQKKVIIAAKRQVSNQSDINETVGRRTDIAVVGVMSETIGEGVEGETDTVNPVDMPDNRGLESGGYAKTVTSNAIGDMSVIYTKTKIRLVPEVRPIPLLVVLPPKKGGIEPYCGGIATER